MNKKLVKSLVLIIVLVLTCSMCLALVGCDDEKDPSTDPGNTPVTPSTPSTPGYDTDGNLIVDSNASGFSADAVTEAFATEFIDGLYDSFVAAGNGWAEATEDGKFSFSLVASDSVAGNGSLAIKGNIDTENNANNEVSFAIKDASDAVLFGIYYDGDAMVNQAATGVLAIECGATKVYLDKVDAVALVNQAIELVGSIKGLIPAGDAAASKEDGEGFYYGDLLFGMSMVDLFNLVLPMIGDQYSIDDDGIYHNDAVVKDGDKVTYNIKIDLVRISGLLEMVTGMLLTDYIGYVDTVFETIFPKYDFNMAEGLGFTAGSIVISASFDGDEFTGVALDVDIPEGTEFYFGSRPVAAADEVEDPGSALPSQIEVPAVKYTGTVAFSLGNTTVTTDVPAMTGFTYWSPLNLKIRGAVEYFNTLGTNNSNYIWTLDAAIQANPFDMVNAKAHLLLNCTDNNGVAHGGDEFTALGIYYAPNAVVTGEEATGTMYVTVNLPEILNGNLDNLFGEDTYASIVLPTDLNTIITEVFGVLAPRDNITDIGGAISWVIDMFTAEEAPAAADEATDATEESAGILDVAQAIIALVQGELGEGITYNFETLPYSLTATGAVINSVIAEINKLGATIPTTAINASATYKIELNEDEGVYTGTLYENTTALYAVKATIAAATITIELIDFDGTTEVVLATLTIDAENMRIELENNIGFAFKAYVDLDGASQDVMFKVTVGYESGDDALRVSVTLNDIGIGGAYTVQELETADYNVAALTSLISGIVTKLMGIA